MKVRKRRNIILMIISVLIIIYGIKKLFTINTVFLDGHNTIVIDPGHGGEDSGTIGFSGSYEKDINLQIAKRLFKKLKSQGYNVILTREKDEYIENELRADMANNNNSLMFISIHGNAMENNDDINGIQVLYYPDGEKENNNSNQDFAQILLEELINKTNANNKGVVARPDLIVLNQTKMPALVVEYGFLTNRQEESLLLKSRYQEKIVQGIVSGLSKYLKSDKKR